MKLEQCSYPRDARGIVHIYYFNGIRCDRVGLRIGFLTHIHDDTTPTCLWCVIAKEPRT